LSSTEPSRISPIQSNPAIAIFARAPVAGRAKTRLIPLLGAQGAAQFQQALIQDTATKVSRLRLRLARWLFIAGGNLLVSPGLKRWHVAPQRGRDLGERLESAFRQLLLAHGRVVIIGTDSPLLTPRLLRLALSELQSCDSVLGPCPDGGFYLIGLARETRGLFQGVRLGTRHAFRDVKKQLLERGFSCSILPEVADIDRPQDFREIAEEMNRRSALRRAAPALWRFLSAPASHRLL
jgi:uncharacterized protein